MKETSKNGDITYLEGNGRYSKAVIHGNIAYLAGQVANNPEPDVARQTAQILHQIDQLLEKCGTDKSRILSAVIYLKDMGCFDQMNQVWDQWVVSDKAPTRTPVEAKLASPEFLVEIQINAVIP